MLNSIWFFPSMLVLITIGIPVVAGLYVHTKKLYNQRQEYQLKQKTVMDCFDDYMYWQPDDTLIVSVDDKHDEMYTLVTFHMRRVLVKPKNRPNEIKIIYPAAIEENKSAQLRIHKRRSDRFHKEVMPSLVEAHNEDNYEQKFLEASNDIN